MNNKCPHWKFHTQVLSRSLKDLETACTVSVESDEFKFLRSESRDIVEEARDALQALEEVLRRYEQDMSENHVPPTRH
ncbi:MAG: hypothetical protein AAF437_06165 [Pseudomonadota bacterium]